VVVPSVRVPVGQGRRPGHGGGVSCEGGQVVRRGDA